MEPSTGERLLRRRGVLQVALHHDVPAEHDLAHRLAVGRDALHPLRVEHGGVALEHVRHALASVPHRDLVRFERFPLLLLRARRTRPVHFGETVGVGELDVDALEAFDH